MKQLKINVVIFLLLLLQGLHSEDKKVYQDDPKILAILNKLGDSSSARLPKNLKQNEYLRKGKRTNDYSMKMLYNPDTQGGLYVGGNHNNNRRNDCYEYHLGSNSWNALFPADGGDHYFLKSFIMYGIRELNQQVKKGKPFNMETFRGLSRLNKTPKTLKLFDEKVIPWWKKNVVIKDGMFQTSKGGPIMPSHTWDGVCYDQTNKQLIWTSGGQGSNPAPLHALINNTTKDEVYKKLNPKYSPMWIFSPGTKKWSRDIRPDKKPYPKFRGMGQSVTYIHDLKIILWYVAVDNVSPGAYDMWKFDCVKKTWKQLKPNGGKSIRQLSVKDKLAPRGEGVLRYSTKTKKLVAFQGANVYAYDVGANVWAKICEDKRIDAHDAKVAIDYDSKNDVFIYSRRKIKGELVRFAVFSLEQKKWLTPTITGPALPKPKWSELKGYYHPVHNVLVRHGNQDIWVYRYKK
ncbi:MAG: hypothetical protein COA79_04280 [Planctomycetota bacterium]|nr:MAG: hypothetical protein COA79_04280 [Planctomycetota bacterium]